MKTRKEVEDLEWRAHQLISERETNRAINAIHTELLLDIRELLLKKPKQPKTKKESS